MIHDRQAQIGFFYLDGTKMPLVRDDYAPMDIEQLPDFFDDMKKAADILCKDFPFVRVDFLLQMEHIILQSLHLHRVVE